ncbi:MAG: hypothetical protein AAFU79_18470 [Myxococcota bacterium]
MSRRLQQVGAATQSLRRRVLGTLFPAAVGCLAGFQYARATLPAEEGGLLGMYATAGAAVAILAVRLGGILWMIIQDFSSSN